MVTQQMLEQLLVNLTQAGVELWVEEGRLRSRAPEGAITPILREQIRLQRDEIITLLQQGSNTLTTRRIRPTPRTQKLPLSFAQQRLWFLAELGSGTAYNMPLSLEIEGKLAITALQQTLSKIVQRHESLRTTFALQEGVPYQVIHPACPFDLTRVDLRGMAGDTQTSEVKRLSAAEALRPFDLSQDLMLRAQVLQLAEEHFVLLLTMHHIASDGWSMGVLVNELATLYAAFAQGKPSPLPELAIQYADFAVWQRNYLQGEVMERQRTWWKAQLADAPDLLQLPTDRPRPAQQSFRGEAVAFEIEAGLTQKLRQLSQQQGCTLYMTLLAAFQVLLHRHTGQAQIVVGSPIANRNHQEVEGLIGFFVNTMALRTNLSGNPSFLDLLAQVQSTIQAAYDHQDLPFERLVEELRPERNLTYNPLVQVMFALQNAPMGDFTLPGLRVKPATFEAKATRLDIETHMWEVDDQLKGYCIYATDLFESATIERMMGHFQELLKGIVAEPTQPISSLTLLTKHERHQLLVEWNNTATDYPKNTCPESIEGKTIHQLFEEQVERTPDAVAVVMAEGSKVQVQGSMSQTATLNLKPETLTYGELNARANQLAHHLQRLGVGPETLVGICVERSLEMVVGLLGILKAGGAYVPLDPAYPQERLNFILQDTHLTLVLTQSNLLGSVPTAPTKHLCIDKDWVEIAMQPQGNLVSEVSPRHLAYVIYTSGSTGQPKGVLLEHRGLVNLSQAQICAFAVQPGDRVLQVASLNFDASIWEIVMALCAGATLVMASPDQLLPAAPLTHTLQTQAISHVTLVPSVLAFLDPITLPNLQTVIVAGEACPPDLAQRWQVGRHFYNAYGPTEITVCATIMACHDSSLSSNILPIGRPIANIQLYILDPSLQPVPLGAPGELYISGAGVARGYLNRPELTTERFIANPFAAGRLYKTGDLVRYLPDGNIEFLGRIDQQVKIRGFRIELGEVEAVLSQHSGVQEALVMAHQEQAGDKQLIAYVVAASADEEIESEHVSTWQNLYEESYSQPSAQRDLSLNLMGWNSSYTGKPIAEEEMREWVENTVAEIRSLQPKRVLEIGCGTGLLLARLAPDCEEYWGMDYSQQALSHVARLRDATPGLAHVQLAQRMADDFTGLSEASFDCVILNSVVQYFPSVDYLLRVLTGAVKLLKPAGIVFVGDVRNYRLLAAYHASVQCYQADDEVSLSELQTRIQQHLQDEEELLIDPAFFHALPQALPAIGAVEVRLKGGRAHNELTRFRYQVFLHIGSLAQGGLAQGSLAQGSLAEDRQAVSNLPLAENEWHQIGSLAALQIRLQTASPTGLWVRNLPNARVQADLEILEELANQRLATVGQLRSQLAKQPSAVDPADLVELAAALCYQVQLVYAAEVGKMDACFIHRSAHPSPILYPAFLPASSKVQPPKAWHSYSNNPLLGKLNRTFVPQLRSYLQSKLPEYMVPAAFVLLDTFPLTPNGKIDRKALPSPMSLRRRDQASLVLPRTATECTIADIWSAVLGIEQIGIHDNFFELGGHSLLATQVVSRIREACAVTLPLRTLFQAPTIAALADALFDAQIAQNLQTPLPATTGESDEMILL